MSVDVQTFFKAPTVTRSKGRARPLEPLAARCEVGVIGVCTIRPTERHHRLPRSAGGGDEKANTLDLCDGCHDVVHDQPLWSYRRGFLLRRSAVA